MIFRRGLFRTITFLLLLLNSVACTDPNGNIVDKQLTLTPSTSQFSIAADSVLTFTATLEDEDVTYEEELQIWHLEANGEVHLIQDAQFAISQAGEYQFYATFTDSKQQSVKSETITVTAISDAILRIETSADMFTQNSDVQFQIYMGGTQIEIPDPNLKLYAISGDTKTELDVFHFTIDELKEYRFSASYSFGGKELESEIKSVSAIEWNDAPYHKRALVTQFTGTWCGYCPRVGLAIYNYTAEFGNKDAVVVSSHVGDVMQSLSSSELDKRMKPDGYPGLYAGSIDKDGAITVEQSAAGIKDAVNQIISTSANTAIKASAKMEEDGIAISAQILVAKDGKYGVASMILEDNIYKIQTNNLSSTNFGSYDYSMHKNVLHAISPLDKYFYAPLSKFETQKARTGYNYESFFPFAGVLSNVSKKENCSAVVFTYNIETRKVDNIIKLTIGESAEFEYEK